MDARSELHHYNPYRVFSRSEWANLRQDTPMTLDLAEVSTLRSLHDRLDITEVEEIYLPMSRLLSIHVGAMQQLYYAQRRFLGVVERKMPYIIGVAGSVAVGKSPPPACCRRCWRAGRRGRRSTSSPPTVFCIPTRCWSAPD